MGKKWYRQIEEALSDAGIHTTGYRHTKKHAKFTITNGSNHAFVITSITPSDHRAIMNIVQSAKRMLATHQPRGQEKGA